MAVENDRDRVHKTSTLGTLSGLDESGCFDELERHGYDHVERRKLLGNANVQFNLGVHYFAKPDSMTEDVEESVTEEEKAEASTKERKGAKPAASGPATPDQRQKTSSPFSDLALKIDDGCWG
jgi:hypothetical protein